MDRNQIAQINTDRLAGWHATLVDKHATPALVLGVGHDHASGTLHLCMTEDTPIETIRGFLLAAIRAIDHGDYTEGRHLGV